MITEPKDNDHVVEYTLVTNPLQWEHKASLCYENGLNPLAPDSSALNYKNKQLDTNKR